VERKLLIARTRILRLARSFRGGPTPDLVQAGWNSTTARGDTRGARSAMQAHVSHERRS